MCDAKYAADGGLDAFKEQKAERKRARDEEQRVKELGKATRAGELVKLLTDAGGASSTLRPTLRASNMSPLALTGRMFAVGKVERELLLAQDCAANFIKRAKSKATAFDIAMQLIATRSGAGGAAAESEVELKKEMDKATRAGELVKLLTERGCAYPMLRVCCAPLIGRLCAVGEAERAPLLTQKCAVSFIKRGKATAFDIANQLMATRGAGASSVAPVMSTPAKAVQRRVQAATPVKHEHDPDVVYIL